MMNDGSDTDSFQRADYYDYELPKELIAQQPLTNREDARMMTIDRAGQAIDHFHVRDLDQQLRQGDCLVLNDTKVIPAKLVGFRAKTGGRWQGLFLESDAGGNWRVLCKTRGKAQPGEMITIQDRHGIERVSLELVTRLEDGSWVVRPDADGTPEEILSAIGRVPLPNYIRGGHMVDSDLGDYQTIFAKTPGAVAAPTAGLHLTQPLLTRIIDAGVNIAAVTLHVGIGTFRPVAAEFLGDHQMHFERGQILEKSVAQILETRRNSKPPQSIHVTVHIPVLPAEVLEGMNPQPGDIVVDGTLGGGGHAMRLLKQIGPTGQLLGFDRDPEAVDETRTRIPDENATLIVSNYANIPEYLIDLGIESVNSILLDLGLSSDQLADRDRGFSFQSEGPLDLRFNPMVGQPASGLVNRLSEKRLADLIYEFGEERFSRRIARKIVRLRHDNKIETAAQLASIVRSCIPRTKKKTIDPATRTFQALRIAVNEELKWLRVAVKRLPECLAIGGTIAVISFHSLEDRIVKQAFVEDDTMEVLTRKPIQASETELAENPRSRSAKLRVAKRVR